MLLISMTLSIRIIGMFLYQFPYRLLIHFHTSTGFQFFNTTVLFVLCTARVKGFCWLWADGVEKAVAWELAVCSLRGNFSLRASCSLRGNFSLRASCSLRDNFSLRDSCSLRDNFSLRDRWSGCYNLERMKWQNIVKHSFSFRISQS